MKDLAKLNLSATILLKYEIIQMTDGLVHPFIYRKKL